jgi:hypothetical protein
MSTLWHLILIVAVRSCFAAAPHFEIQVVDSETGRGVPCVELETVNHIRYVTDSAGRIAYHEPGHEGQSVFFTPRSHGYEFAKDGFGMTGVRLKITPGGKETIKARRLNFAERLYRSTGEGIYRDTLLLGYPAPIAQPLLNANVAGQDSIQRVIFRGKVHWFWGDTPYVSYPLGNFRMSGAVSDVPSNGGLDPSIGINYRYFTGADGSARGMFPIKPEGDLIWADGFLVITNRGEETMLAHFQRLKGLSQPLGRGLAIYNSVKEEFELLKELSLDEKWRFPHGHPIRRDGYFLFGGNFPTVRVRTEFDAITNQGAYEAWSCLPEGGSLNSKQVVTYRWTKNAPPTGNKEEKSLIDAGVLKPEQAHFQPRDLQSGRVVQMHAGTVNWNAWRKKWIMIASEIGGSSMLGEIWYSEADEPTGPWKSARKIVTHDKYSFYNPAHHPFFDQEDGRIIYFEGTYTAEFSGSHTFTPRYDYNQIYYRLDLAKAALP